jgi:hypothetical protein
LVTQPEFEKWAASNNWLHLEQWDWSTSASYEKAKGGVWLAPSGNIVRTWEDGGNINSIQIDAKWIPRKKL